MDVLVNVSQGLYYVKSDGALSEGGKRGGGGGGV